MEKIKCVYIEKKKSDFSQQIVAIFFYCLIIECRGHFERRNYGGQHDEKNNNDGFAVYCSLWWSILFSL